MDEAYVIKFPHPGGEHNPGKTDRQGWNTGADPWRKFLQSVGRWIDADGNRSETNLVFWGEWEPPSLITERWPVNGDLPRFLHKPIWEHPTSNAPRQNTDPWVFGNGFRYSNCKQLAQAGLRKLPPGSVIFFGSTLYGKFVVDTVFVVANATPFTPRHAPNVDDAFRVCTIESLRTMGLDDYDFTLYDGATLEEPFGGMFSFVPCRRVDAGDYRFARPVLNLPCSYKVSNTRQPYGTKDPLTMEQVFERWDDARRQVLSADCLLGTH